MTPWSMSRRLVVSMTGIIGGLWLCGVAYIGFSVHHEIGEVFDSALQETAQRLLPIAAHDLRHRAKDSGETQDLDDLVTGDHKEYIHYQVRNRDGRVVLRSHDAPRDPYPVPLVAGFASDGERRYFTELSPTGDVAVQVAELPRERNEALRALWLGLLVPLLAVLPLAALAIRQTVQSTTRPVSNLRAELHARDGANLAPLVTTDLPEELSPIVEDVNRLLGRLGGALEAERAFAANSAHELRNPIAAAQAQARLLVQDAENEEQQRRAQGLEVSLGRLSRKIEALLQLARAEAGVAYTREDLSLRDLTTMIVEEYARKPRAQSRLVFDVMSDDAIPVKGDADALGIAIQNLIDNALKHSPAQTPIHIVLGPGPILRIRNAGPASDARELTCLKDRFQRGRNGAQNGSGLGLYITDIIARQSGGTLNIFSPARNEQSGFEVELDLSGQQAHETKS